LTAAYMRKKFTHTRARARTRTRTHARTRLHSVIFFCTYIIMYPNILYFFKQN